MAANIITQEDLDLFKSELFEKLETLFSSRPEAQEVQKGQENQQPKWLKSYQVQRLLGISPGTLQNLRINGTLPYTKIGGIILYSNEDIQRLIIGNMRNTQNYGKV
jgi:hypothetical protein